MTLEVSRHAKVGNACPLVCSSDSILLTARVWMGNSASLAVSEPVLSVVLVLKLYFMTYALIAVPLIMARIGSLSARAFFKLLTYNAPIPSALA